MVYGYYSKLIYNKITSNSSDDDVPRWIYTFRVFTKRERNLLHMLIEDNQPTESGYQTKIILHRDHGYAIVPEIQRTSYNHHMTATVENGFIIIMKKV